MDRAERAWHVGQRPQVGFEPRYIPFWTSLFCKILPTAPLNVPHISPHKHLQKSFLQRWDPLPLGLKTVNSPWGKPILPVKEGFHIRWFWRPLWYLLVPLVSNLILMSWQWNLSLNVRYFLTCVSSLCLTPTLQQQLQAFKVIYKNNQ